jgi:holo-[acyl-carrier protein] synthase
VAESIGIDLVETERIRQILKKYGMRFVNRILGQQELLTYSKRGDKANYLAGRFAAKEAVIKSLGRFLKDRPAYNVIQIINDDSGNPLLNDTGVISEKIKNKRCLISISHERHYATAVSIISAGQ